jgi:hypothetical protein
MKKFLLMCTAIISVCIASGCSPKPLLKASSPASQYQNNPQSQISDSRAKSKNFVFDNAEVVGYLDNPTPVYLTESSEKNQNIDEELEKLKQELETLPENGNQSGLETKYGLTKQQILVKKKRMITYDGFISSRSIKPDSLISSAVALAESLKGYIEVRNGRSVTLRIPVPKFGIVYDSLLRLGEVIDYQRSAEDITDLFRDTDLRVAVLEKTIERYVKLIRLVKEEKEKISLLKEIERLREELESLRVQKSVLALRAEFAKIVYSVQQVTTGFAGIQQSTQMKGFQWISNLDPVSPYRFGRMLKLKIPDGMVKVKHRNYWITQSPAGSRIWTAKVPNNPEGTSDFWINGLAFELQERFLTVDTSSASGYRFIRCTPQQGVNYRYDVGIKVVRNKVHILQCFFTDEIQENRYFDNVKKILAADGGAS